MIGLVFVRVPREAVTYSLLLGDLVASTNSRLRASTLRNTLTRTGHAAVEVHAVDTNRRIVLDA
jgi:hypothetical protein